MNYPIPIIKIDDPLFHEICVMDKPLILAFTNPNTVKGTMNQLFRFAESIGKELQAESILLENTFELIMQGKQQEYIEAVSQRLEHIATQYPDKVVIAAQLSIVPAAQRVEEQTDKIIVNHLDSLSRYMKEVLILDG